MTAQGRREFGKPFLSAVHCGENATRVAAIRVCPYVEPTAIVVVVNATIGVIAL